MPGPHASAYASKTEKILSKVEYDTNGGCWLWRDAPNTWGYGTFNWGGAVLAAHRVSYEEANGPIGGGLSVLHRCDTPACVNPAHLFLGTQLDNMRDMHSKGRWSAPLGERHHRAKLTDAQALEIRARRRNGETERSVAESYGVHRNTVYDITSGKNFKHLENA